MYTIELHLPNGTKPMVLKFKHKDEAYDEWDRMVDNAIPGDKVVFKLDGVIISHYQPAQ